MQINNHILDHIYCIFIFYMLQSHTGGQVTAKLQQLKTLNTVYKTRFSQKYVISVSWVTKGLDYFYADLSLHESPISYTNEAKAMREHK